MVGCFQLYIFSLIPYCSFFCLLFLSLQIGIGLLVLQQLSGVNGILFYAASIFKAAGMF